MIYQSCKQKCSYVKELENEIRKLKIENEKLKKDNLTNVWNRHYLDEMLKNVYLPKINKGWEYNVFMIDIDELHEYNRKYKYNEGDKYILNIINNIKEEMKKQNVSGSIFRTGGNEFLIFIQPYDELYLENIKNITYAKTKFKYPMTIRDVIKKSNKIIIRKKLNKNKKEGDKC